MSDKFFLRTAKEFVLDDVCRHLLVVGELKGDCFNCKEIGIDYLTEKSCPKCGMEFRYISYRPPSNSRSPNFTNLLRKRPDLIYIEFEDIKRQKDKASAKDFFFK